MDDDDFMYDDDAEDFEYEEDDGNEETDLGIENKYYNAKAQRDDFDKAVKEFTEVVHEDSEEPSMEWGFKATKQLIKLHLRNHKFAEMLEYYDQMLEYVRTTIKTRNYAEKSINNMLDRISANTSSDITYTVYKKTLHTLKEMHYDRLHLRTSLRLSRLLVDQGKYDDLESLLGELKQECRSMQGDPIAELGTQVLEINAMYLEMYDARGESQRLKETYLECTAVKSAIPHPRVMGFIEECGGKMFMNERNWVKAQVSLFNAFKNYDEAGSPRRIRVLKYLVLASMLCESEVSPLSSPEAKAYESDPAIIAMSKMVRAYESQDAYTFERVLSDHKSEIEDDPFICGFVADLHRIFRIQALEAAVLPYTTVYLSSLAKSLRTSVDEVESILFELILDGRLKGSIDQQRGLLLLEKGTSDAKQYEALQSWAKNVASLMRSSYAVLN
ncbi:COP9 signalosome complex subunit 2 [Coemansia sp. RSA 1813]|nr:COP9 signalosome complex subunit 2 [Coemansia sp. RSA 1646]KAJ1766185.1 COP9 signalosome complex subunit 2 [Coemansia sp. RSA 1843]KAJ2086838.1 COP9 signalosome complex subunit 2 [Coemansia sp. RSA 986]KAJ2211603.1 COP9 signalosome complex subunit 2 [Coemansia sp. RSA 487]KAJ2565215.1 COP9 signalosome complex subunit 2 [Coemansia sp. RSA 1813]